MRSKGMFNISTKVQYGFLALLALADHPPGEPVHLRTIARDLHLSFKYLERIFARLGKAGIVRGLRGPGGGYILMKNPHRLALRDIFNALEGPIFTVECFDEMSVCGHVRSCPVRDLWSELRGHLEHFLRKKTLADVKRRRAASPVRAHIEVNAPFRTAEERRRHQHDEAIGLS